MTLQVFLEERVPPVGEDPTVITPNENAATTLGLGHLSLETLARLSLAGGKWAANPVQVGQLAAGLEPYPVCR
jgi:hypothetical protein